MGIKYINEWLIGGTFKNFLEVSESFVKVSGVKRLMFTNTIMSYIFQPKFRSIYSNRLSISAKSLPASHGPSTTSKHISRNFEPCVFLAVILLKVAWHGSPAHIPSSNVVYRLMKGHIAATNPKQSSEGVEIALPMYAGKILGYLSLPLRLKTLDMLAERCQFRVCVARIWIIYLDILPGQMESLHLFVYADRS